MKKIIVPTDFSEQAMNALSLAYEMAQKINAKILLMHVIEHSKKQTTFMGSTALNTTASMTTGIEMDDIYFIELFKKRKKQMMAVLEDSAFAGVEIIDKIMLGTPYHAIEEEITESEADFIIMGTTGVSNWEESLIGSTAEKVVRHASCPVLTLRKKIKMSAIKRIAFASDFREEKPVYIRLVKKMCELFDAELHLVYINTPSHFKNEREVEHNLKSFALSNDLVNFKTHVYSHLHEEEGIVWFTEDHKMDMVMMATSGRTGFSRLFEHSIAEDVVNFSKKPVLTFNLHQIKK